VFDGHGGPRAADFAAEDIPRRIAARMQQGQVHAPPQPDTRHPSTLNTQHSTLNTQHSTLNTPGQGVVGAAQGLSLFQEVFAQVPLTPQSMSLKYEPSSEPPPQGHAGAPVLSSTPLPPPTRA